MTAPVSEVSEVFGQMVSAAQIEDAVSATLRKWLPGYLSEMERQLGWSSNPLEAPKNYLNRDNFIAQKSEEIPKLVVISQGLAGQPTVYQGTYSAAWQVGVGIATAATPEARSNRLVKAYAAAIRTCVSQNQTFGTGPDDPDNGTLLFVARATWVGENYNDVLTDNQIALYKSASVHFVIELDNVAKKWGGPTSPSLNVPPEHTVQTIHTDIQIVDSVN